ncbi:MAG TPA: BREX-3 system P-loop-containing protein BrxF [Firmicutes bacterium]|jgi:hypothetical protein|nr:BREX-3 system P-loop-containing protein BrxF [Bacillota bacterium]
MIVETVRQQISEAAQRDEKLVILVGRPGSGKSRILRQFSKNNYLDLKEELSKRLLSIPREKRSERAFSLLQEIVESKQEPVLLFDNIEILFLQELDMDPLKVLGRLSREKTLVVAWVGYFDGTELSWSEPGRPDYKTFSIKERDLLISSILD